MRGLALEGGGAKGSYHIGAYRALLKCGYKFNAIAGTSIGAVNAAMICQGDFKVLENLWKELDATVFNLDAKVVHSIVHKNVDKQDIKDTFNKVVEILKNKGIDTNNFRDLLNKYIDEDRVRKSKIKFGLVTVRLSDFTPLELTIDEIPKGKLKDYIMASCYLPVFNLKKIIDDKYYLDGGFTNVLPITLLERMGCKEIIGIRVKKFGLIKKKRKPTTKVTIIKPDKNIGSVMILDHDRTILNMKKGYIDTLKTIKKYDGEDYCFKRRTNNLYRFLSRNISQVDKKKLMKKYHVENEKELSIFCLEQLMHEMSLDPYKIYDPWEVVKTIKKKYRYKKKSNICNYIVNLKKY